MSRSHQSRLNFGGTRINPETIIDQLLPRRMWLLPEASPFVHDIAKGDRLLIYAAGRKGAFYAIAEAAGQLTELDQNETPEELRQTIGFFRYALRIERVSRFRKPLPIKEVLGKLSFIKNKEYWGLHFRRGLRRINVRDFSTIVGEAKNKR